VKNDSEQASRIDLGDDLLEATRVDSRPQAESDRELELSDQLQSAKILIAEGLLDEAKKVLRKILITDHKQAIARQLLEEIHEKELKHLLGDSTRRRFLHSKDQKEEAFSEALTEQVIRQLDHDLRLGIFNSDGTCNFLDPQTTRDYADRIEREFPSLTAQNRLDLGIAFFEMGLYEIAARQFKAASQGFFQESHKVLEATALLAQTLISAGKSYEAVQLLQTFLGDIFIAPESKIEFIYLIGLAYEVMNELELAGYWYEQTAQVDPDYRDIEIRLDRIRRILSSV